jgi:outer membrane lipoprotein-sorting protein
MNALRRISTRKLLVLCASVVAVLIGGTVIAMATTQGGPTPPPRKLPAAIHDALTASPVDGVTARVQFTNHLIDSASVQGTDPILTGASGRLWASSDGHVRLELQADPSSNGGVGDAQVLLDPRHASVYNSGTDTIYRANLGAGHAEQTPSIAQIQRAIRHVSKLAMVSGAIPSDVAGRAAYTVRVSPRHDGGLLGGAELAWDAAHGTPLRAAVYASGNSSPVLELKLTDIAFGKVSPSVFDVTPPKGAKVTNLSPSIRHRAAGGNRPNETTVSGLAAVQKRSPFEVTAPAKLAGLPRGEVRLVSSGRHSGALVTYGHGLGGIAVIELPAGKAHGSSGPAPGEPDGEQPGLQLPKVSINGSVGDELDTALGTVIRFERGGVSYVVAGSVPPAAAEAAARGL